MRAFFIVVLAPILQLFLGIRKTQEPVSVHSSWVQRVTADCKSHESGASHEARVSGEISGPIAKVVRRHQHHWKCNAHAMVDRNANGFTHTGKEGCYLRRPTSCRQRKCGPESGAHPMWSCDGKWAHVSDLRDVGIAHTVIPVMKKNAIPHGVVQK